MPTPPRTWTERLLTRLAVLAVPPSLLPALAALCVLAAACGSVTGLLGGAQGPANLQPASHRTPSGTERVVCMLTEPDGGRTRFALDLPDDVRERRTTPTSCRWTHEVRLGGPAFYEAVVEVSLAADAERTLQQQHDLREQYVVDDDSPAGDDSILHLRLDENVPVFGDTVGDRLSSTCFCDGQNTLDRTFEADGVRVEWTSCAPLQRETDREIERALRGAGLV